MTTEELDKLIDENITFDHRRINILSMGFNCYAQAQLNKSQIYSPAHILSHAIHPHDLDFTPQYEMIKREFCDIIPENVKGETRFQGYPEDHVGFVMGPDQFNYSFPHYNIWKDGAWEYLINKRIKSLMDRLKDSSKPRFLYTYVDRYGYVRRDPGKEAVYIRRDFNREAKIKLIDNAIKFYNDLLALHPCPHQKLIIGVGSNNVNEILRPIMQMKDIEVWFVHNIEWSRVEKMKKFIDQNNYPNADHIKEMFAFNHGVMNTGIIAPHITQLILETMDKKKK